MTTASAAAGTAHHRWTGFGSLGARVSVNDLTIRAALIAGLAIVALLLTGWRKAARATPKTARGDAHHPRQVPVAVVRQPTPAYHAPNPVRRLWSLLASGALTVVVGAVIATVLAVAVALVVTRMTDLLGQ
jgi:hypothetical protein